MTPRDLLTPVTADPPQFRAVSRRNRDRVRVLARGGITAVPAVDTLITCQVKRDATMSGCEAPPSRSDTAIRVKLRQAVPHRHYSAEVRPSPWPLWTPGALRPRESPLDEPTHSSACVTGTQSSARV